MAFIPFRYDSGKIVQLGAAASKTFTRGGAVDVSVGYLTPATSATAEVRYVAMETKTTSSSVGDLLLVIYTDKTEFVADTATNPAQTNVFTKCDLSTVALLAPGTSSNKVFWIQTIQGALTDNTVRGYFIMKTT